MEIGQWLMETSVGSWIMHIPSNMFIPFGLLYALAIFIVGICLIAARQRAAIRIQTKHIPAPVLTLQDLAAFSNLSAFHVTALRLYERYLKGEVRIRQEDFYIHEMNESDEDTEDAQTPIQYLKAHTQKSSIVADARPSNSDYSRMLSAGNQVSFSKYQKGYNKRCSIVRRPVIWGSVVLIYLPILIRMNIGIYRGKAVRNLEAVMILGAFGLFIGYLLVSISDGSRVQDSFQSACRKAAEEAFPRRDGMDSLVLKAEENATSLTD